MHDCTFLVYKMHRQCARRLGRGGTIFACPGEFVVLEPGVSMRRTLLGMLTPSSNTVLEPVTAALLAEVPEASAHFGRFAVTEIALSDQALAQFAPEEILRAARLLAHARCEVIAWNGTSAGWLGFERDEALCAAITRETGAQACTSVLAINELFAHYGVRRFGLVTPYVDDVQQAIIANYQRAGFDCAAERHLGLQDNFSFSEVDAATLQTMVRAVARERPDAIVVLCTNLRGASLAPALEAELGLPVIDSISAVVWKSLRLAGIDVRRIRAWGRLFQEAV
jgi:maleate isomerase